MYYLWIIFLTLSSIQNIPIRTMLAQFEDMEIMAIEDYTHDTKRYWLRYINLEDVRFDAGQFITFDLPISDKKNQRWRSYSIANEPNDNGIFELIIKKFEQGDGGSKYIYEEWERGMVVQGRPPQGKFTITESDAHAEYLFLCTGVGIAPFRSMIYRLFDDDMDFSKIILVFGTKKHEDLLYYEEFKNLSDENKNFEFHACLSREKHEGFIHGRIDKVYPDLVSLKHETQKIFICGWRDMIDATRKQLAEMGVDKSRIHFEIYG